MDSGRRSGLDRFDPHVLALSLLFRMSELRQRVALICELSVFTQLLFFVALGPQMEVREQPRCKAEIVFLITINFANTPPLLFANFHPDCSDIGALNESTTHPATQNHHTPPVNLSPESWHRGGYPLIAQRVQRHT